MDAMGHVNNAVYLTYFEVARSGYMSALGHCQNPSPTMAELFPFIVASIRCQYLSPAGLADALRVYLRTRHIGNKSFVFDYLVTTGARRVAMGESTQVYYDYHEQQTRPVPESFSARVGALEAWPSGKNQEGA